MDKFINLTLLAIVVATLWLGFDAMYKFNTIDKQAIVESLIKQGR